MFFRFKFFIFRYTTNFFYFIFSLVFFLCGFFIKLGLAPFHFWVPQIYSGVPNIITLVLLTLPKFGLFIVFMKLYLFVFKFIYIIFFDKICLIVILSLLLDLLVQYKKSILSVLWLIVL